MLPGFHLFIRLFRCAATVMMMMVMIVEGRSRNANNKTREENGKEREAQRHKSVQGHVRRMINYLGKACGRRTRGLKLRECFPIQWSNERLGSSALQISMRNCFVLSRIYITNSNFHKPIYSPRAIKMSESSYLVVHC